MEFFAENPIFFLAGFTFLGFFILGLFVRDLRRKVAMLFGGKGNDKSDGMKNVVRRLYQAEERIHDMDPRISAVEDIAKTSIHKIGFLRFNPFQDTGGDNSFVIAFLDQENSGVVLTSFYTREGVRVYGKNIKSGQSFYSLSGEEKKTLEEAMDQSSKLKAQSSK